MKLLDSLTFVLLLLACGSVCHAQFETIPNIASQTPTGGRTKAVHRTIITYNGAVCLSTPSYELMPNGQVIFKHQGMRFDGSGYFWSPSIPDSIVRRNHYETRIVGTTNQYWPPLTPTTQSFLPNIRRNQISLKPNTNPYFGSGTHTVTRRDNQPSTRMRTGTSKSARLVRCPNGSYAIICR